MPKKKPFVLITGATGGLGSNLAKVFFERGYEILLQGRNPGLLESLKKSMGGHHSIHILVCDLTSERAVNQFSIELNERFDRIDVLINNAAIHGPISPLSKCTLEDWKSTFQVNLFGPVALCKAVIPLMANSINGGSIINISGGGATGPRPNFSAYASSKAALVRFTETLSSELLSTGIRVNAVSPGPMRTLLLKEVLDLGEHAAGKSEFLSASKIFNSSDQPMNNTVELILFLAGSESSGITGKLISAQWDLWRDWPMHLSDLQGSDVYTLKRVIGRDRGMLWGDV